MDWNLILTVTFVGIAIVFGALLILSYVIEIYPKIFLKNKTKLKLPTEPKAVPKISILEDISETMEDEELIAVIAGAISAFSESDYSSKIVVKKIKRVDDNPPVWNNIGRLEALN